MTTATDVVGKARGQLGYNGTGSVDNPSSKFGQWYGIDPGHWCAMFVSWALTTAGLPLKIETTKGFAFCPTGVAWAKRNGHWFPKPATPVPGDLVFFSFGGVRPDHVGIVTAFDPKSRRITSIQGNTDDSSMGRKGNCCRLKGNSERHVLGYLRPPYGTAKAAAHPVQRTHTVQPGDTLAAIARRLLGDPGRFREIARLNGIANPDVIRVGQVLKIPPR